MLYNYKIISLNL